MARHRREVPGDEVRAMQTPGEPIDPHAEGGIQDRPVRLPDRPTGERASYEGLYPGEGGNA